MSEAVRLRPSEQRVAAALEARGLSLGNEISRASLELLAADLGCQPVTVQTHVFHIRRQLRAAGELAERPKAPSSRRAAPAWSDGGNRDLSPAEAAERLERRPVTRAMLTEAALDFARAAAGGRSAAELREQWATVGAWLGTL